MTSYYLGIDVGASKSQALIVNAAGETLGWGKAGAGNHEQVGFDGLIAVLNAITDEALARASITRDQIAGAGFGLCGYDWQSEHEAHLQAVATLGLNSPVEIVNDAVIGLVAGAEAGWGVCVVSGTSANCWGRDTDGRHGHVVGVGQMFGEAGGGGELVQRALWAIAQAYTRIGDPTLLTDIFMHHVGASTAEDLIEGCSDHRYVFGARDSGLVLQAVEAGDKVAQALIQWIGTELSKLAIAVIRQLSLQDASFDVVLAGNFYRSSPVIEDTLTSHVLQTAPHARIVRLHADPVVGGALLGMECARCDPASIAHARVVLTR